MAPHLAAVLVATAFVATPRSPHGGARRAVVAMAEPTAAAGDKEDFVLDGQKVAELLDAAFVPAVMGVARGDVTELKLFIAAAQAARGLTEPVDTLCTAMRALPVQAAGRPLAVEEEALRRLWLSLTYMTLELLEAESGDAQSPPELASVAGVPPAISADHAPFVVNLVSAKREGRSLSELSIDEMMVASGGSRSGGASAMERAVLQQSMRVVFLTVDVVEDEKLAGTRADAGPKIPGASSGAS